jgi:hypothetical protein
MGELLIIIWVGETSRKKSSKIILTFTIAACVLLPSGMIVSASIKPLSNYKSIGEQKKAPFETDKFM